MDYQNHGREVLHIKKYPNRRYYDMTRSAHVTLHEVHDLILTGKDVCITDSKTGEDITNLVLTQILLEKDQPKLDIFPAAIFHMMIRSNRQVLRGYVDHFFSPFMSIMASSQKQFDQYLRSATGGAFMTPLEWTNRIMEMFGGRSTQADGAAGSYDPEWDSAPPETADEAGGRAPGVRAGRDSQGVAPSARVGEDSEASIDELRDQAAELMRRIEALSQPAAQHGPANDVES
jgi:polyhydroxyalkanoate synthesis repressor PhaR